MDIKNRKCLLPCIAGFQVRKAWIQSVFWSLGQCHLHHLHHYHQPSSTLTDGIFPIISSIFKSSLREQSRHFLFLGQVSGEGNGTPLQCSCLENPMDGGAW